MARILGVLILFLVYVGLFSPAGAAMPAPGTRIINQAQISYYDTEFGELITILSNEANLVVAPYVSHDQNQNTNQTALAGQPVYFPHTVINTGNVADSYRLLLENLGGDGGDLTDLKIYLDVNGDGQVNPGEPEISETQLIQPGERIQVVVAGVVPAQAALGQQYAVRLTSISLRDNNQQSSNTDTVTLGDGAIIRINRSSDTYCNVPLTQGRTVYAEVGFTNTGNAAPVAREMTVDGKALQGYVLMEESLSEYVNLLAGSDFLALPTGSIPLVWVTQGWLPYGQWDGNSKVSKIGVLVPVDSLKANQSGKFGYTLQVISQPSDNTTVYSQIKLDINGDGTPEFSSDPNSCLTIAKNDEPDPEGLPGVISGIVFDSANLNRVSGAQVSLMSGGDAKASAKVLDTVTTDAQGVYAFTNIPAGQYYLQVVPPGDYIMPSVYPAAYFPVYKVSNPSYGLPGFVPAGGTATTTNAGVFVLDDKVVGREIDIPLDRQGIGGKMSIEKTASKADVAIGDMVSYTIKVRNLSGGELYVGFIKDQLPYGFKYLWGTAKLNGQTTADPMMTPGDSPAGARLAFPVGKMPADAEFTLNYITLVTAAAVGSEGINTAYAHADTLTNVLIQSPTVKSKVSVKQEGVLSDRAILFGRIAVEPGCPIGDDKKRQESGWPLANVRLYMEDGTYVVSDSEGQFSLYGLKPGLHVLKVDGHTLPEGVLLKATDVAHAGDPDSRFVDLLPGDFHRADFTALCPEAAKERTEQVCTEKLMDEQGKEWTTRTVPNIISPLHFDSGRAEIKPEYMEKLRKLLELAKDKHNARFGFIGHTDNQRLKPATKALYRDNQGLSEARAKEAAEFVLQNLGQELEINVSGKGEIEPVASNATPDGMAQNRRVEMVLIYDEPVEKHAETVRKNCTTRTVPGENVVAQRILARSKAASQGSHNEMDTLDPGNLESLGTLARQAEAGKDGDVSSGLMEAYKRKVQKQQDNVTNGKVTDDVVEKETPMPLAKEVVKDITNAQAKTGTWLWPLNDTSLDGRFMVVVPTGITPSLQVNGQPVADSHLGEQIVNKREEAQLMAWYGVTLDEGENRIKVVGKDNFGNERVLAEKVFKRPSAAVAVKLTVDGTLTADGGRSSVPVKVQVVDRNGYPAKGTYFMTLEASDGQWVEADIQDKVPGHQIKITSGERTVHLRSSNQTGQVKVRVSTGTLQSDVDVSQVAEMRPLIAAGLLDLRAHTGYGDSYDSVVLQQLQDESNGVEVDGRAALFMKGRIKHDMHLTFAYDNQKDADTYLLRDVDPAAYYQVYGDSSIRGYEAQSRSRLYAKLEKDRHSVMWGDYVTDSSTVSNANIAKVQRTLTGLNGIYDDGKTRVQVFAAQQDNPRATEEIPGNGTALNYQLQGVPMVRNSEIVEVITRDRANAGLILSTEKLVRFRDYTLDEVTGHITFHRTIPTLDDELNPVTVRISYDKEAATEAHTVAGVRAEHKVTEGLTVGASYTHDDHPVDGAEITGAHAQYKDEKTTVELGVARMEHADETREDGKAVRLQATRKWGDGSRTDFVAAQADAGFTNTSSGVQADRREIKLTHEQKIAKNLTAKAELVDSASLSTEAERRSAELSVIAQIEQWKLKGGMRSIVQSDGLTRDSIRTALLGVERNVELFGKKGSIKAEHEREVGDDSRQRTTVGANLQIDDKTSAYVRYEKADRLAGGTLAGAVDTQSNLVAGVKTQVLPSTEMYSEYRIEGDISGEDVVAVNGGKATLNLDQNLVVTPSIEFMDYQEGSTKQDSIAASVGIRDTRSPDSKKLLRLETRQSDDEKYYGVNGSYVTRVNENVTAMVGDELRYTTYSDGREDNIQNTLTVAAAHRPKEGGPYNALYSYKWKKDTQDDENTHILSTHQHYRVDEKTDLSGRLGFKQQNLQAGDVKETSRTLLLAGHAQKDLTERMGVDVHAGLMTTGNDDQRYLAGAGVNYRIMKNVRVAAGYNIAGTSDNDLDPNGAYAQGGYVGLQLKVDEDMFDWLADKPDKDKGCRPPRDGVASKESVIKDASEADGCAEENYNNKANPDEKSSSD